MCNIYVSDDWLLQVASRPGFSESLQQLVEIAKNPAANVANLSGVIIGEDRTNQPREKKVAEDSFIRFFFSQHQSWLKIIPRIKF